MNQYEWTQYDKNWSWISESRNLQRAQRSTTSLVRMALTTVALSLAIVLFGGVMSTTYLHISLPPLVYMSLAFLTVSVVCALLAIVLVGYAFIPLMMKLSRLLKYLLGIGVEKETAYPFGTPEDSMTKQAILKEYQKQLDSLKDFDFQE